jgi:hypothetical protein
MDVPLQVSNPPPGTDEYTEEPGAKSVRNDATLEKDETEFPSVADPTLTAEEMHPGALNALV